jgi:hypothetical protein
MREVLRAIQLLLLAVRLRGVSGNGGVDDRGLRLGVVGNSIRSKRIILKHRASHLHDSFRALRHHAVVAKFARGGLSFQRKSRSRSRSKSR